MASKFMVNAAFKARLLLRPSHQRTVLFGTVNKLGCPIPGRPMLPLILSSRSYSESTPTPPLPKPSGSTESSQSSGPEDKTYSDSTPTPPFPKSSGPTQGSQSSRPEDKTYSDSTPTPPFPKSSGPTEGSQSSGPKDTGSTQSWAKAEKALAGGLVTLNLGLCVLATEPIWKNWYQNYQRRKAESARTSAIYDTLKKGPVIQKAIENIIPRNSLIEEIRQLITPAEESRFYPLIIGEHGTGKTSLIKLAVDGMDEPKGVIYLDVDIDDDSELDIAEAMRIALGWDSGTPVTVSLREILRDFTRLAIKYEQEYGKIPVWIIDNANKLAQKQPSLLELFQDYAKSATDNGTVTVVFVSSEVPRRMWERSSWSRSGDIIEIGDVSKEEALQYLELRKIDKEQAAQIYELVGGRTLHLKNTADKIKRGGTLEAMRQTMFSNIKSQLLSAEIAPEHRYHKDGAKIIRELLKKGSISEDAYYSLVGRDTGIKLLEANIFAFHYNSQEITFQSTVMKRYCEENLALWEPGLRTRTWCNW